MATVIQIKRSSGTSKPSALAQGELAYSYGVGGSFGEQLFIGTGVETDGEAANIDVIGGKYFTDKLDHAIGTLTASSAILVDSNKAIDEIIIGNSSTIGGTLKLNEGTNNGAHFVALKAPNSVTQDTTFTLPDGDGTNGQFLKTDGSGNLSFGTVTTTLSIAADSGSNDSVSTGETITFSGDTGISTSVTNNEITIDLDDTAVTPGSYGSATSIPTFTVDQQGRLTAAGTASVATTLTIADDSSTNASISLLTDTLTINGGTGITSSISGDTISLDIDSTVATLTGTQELTNKTINSDSNTITLDLGEGTLTGTLAEFNTAVSDATLVSTTGTETLSNKTLTAPKFADGGFIADGNGNELILLQTTTSAVNELEITNAATGNAVQIATSGGDTNIDLKISPKGSGDVDVDSSRITNVTDPSGAQYAATKAYVDSVANGLDVKASVRYASTANIAGTYDNGAGTITAGSNGALSIDGQTPSTNDRVLLKDQTDAVQNGLYRVTTVGDGSSAYVLTRTPDGDEAVEITGGAFVFVEEGNTNADNGYVFTLDGTPTLGTTNITVAQFSGAGQISAGDALTKTGNTLDVAVDDTTIEVSGDALQVKASGIGTNQLADTAVTAGKLATNAVETDKINNNAVTVAKLATTLDLSSNTVTLPSSFTTNTGTQTLTNKTIDSATNTITVDLSEATVTGTTAEFNSALSDGSFATLAGTETLTNKTINGSNNTISNIANSSLTNSTITIRDESSTEDAIGLGETLIVTGGEGIDTTIASNTLTIAAELATTSNKGVASFSADNFAVSSGAVTVTTIDGGTF